MRRVTLLLISALWLMGFSACASGKPTGPLFSALTEPGPADTLVYIYRADALWGIDAVELRLNGEKLGKMKNGEFLAFMIDPGEHEIRVRLRWLGVIPRSWNRLAFEALPGQTLYLRIWAQYRERATGPTASQTPGRSDGNADLALFMAPWNAEDATRELAKTRRAPGP